MKTILSLSFLIISIISFSQSKNCIVNQLMVSCMDYKKDKLIPSPTSNYKLRIEQLMDFNPGNDRFFAYLCYDSLISSTEPVRFNDSTGLKSGHYLISCTKDSLVTFIDVVYISGIIQLNLTLRPSLSPNNPNTYKK